VASATEASATEASATEASAPDFTVTASAAAFAAFPAASVPGDTGAPAHVADPPAATAFHPSVIAPVRSQHAAGSESKRFA